MSDFYIYFPGNMWCEDHAWIPSENRPATADDPVSSVYGRYGRKKFTGYPEGTKLVTFAEAQTLQDEAARAKYCKGLEEKTEEDFWYALEVLPPCNHAITSGVEIFYVSERVTGNLVHWWLQYKDRYFTTCEDAKIEMAVLIQQVKEKVNAG